MSVISSLISLAITWWCTPVYVKVEEEDAAVVCEEVKRAIYKMGPGYSYKMVNKDLYINRGDGKWLRLNYEKED